MYKVKVLIRIYGATYVASVDVGDGVLLGGGVVGGDNESHGADTEEDHSRGSEDLLLRTNNE